jgi:hypothetical protein
LNALGTTEVEGGRDLFIGTKEQLGPDLFLQLVRLPILRTRFMARR